MGLVHTVARKVHKRLLAAGSSMQYDDVFQSAAESFLLCQKGWDSSKGTLSTYYMRSSYNNFAKIIDKELRECHGHFSEVGYTEEPVQAEALEEAVHAVEKAQSCFSTALNPETLANREDTLQKLAQKLSPVAQYILTNLIEPSEEIEAAAREIEKRSTWAVEIGLSVMRYQAVNMNLICQALMTAGLPRKVVVSARKELKNAVIS